MSWANKEIYLSNFIKLSSLPHEKTGVPCFDAAFIILV